MIAFEALYNRFHESAPLRTADSLGTLPPTAQAVGRILSNSGYQFAAYSFNFLEDGGHVIRTYIFATNSFVDESSKNPSPISLEDLQRYFQDISRAIDTHIGTIPHSFQHLKSPPQLTEDDRFATFGEITVRHRTRRAVILRGMEEVTLLCVSPQQVDSLLQHPRIRQESISELEAAFISK